MLVEIQISNQDIPIPFWLKFEFQIKTSPITILIKNRISNQDIPVPFWLNFNYQIKTARYHFGWSSNFKSRHPVTVIKPMFFILFLDLDARALDLSFWRRVIFSHIIWIMGIIDFLVPWSNHHNNSQIICFLVLSRTNQPNLKLLVKIEPLGEDFGPLLA